MRATVSMAGLLACGTIGFPISAQNLIQNGDFETGDFSHWTLYTTPNGTISGVFGLPAVVSFDVAGSGTASFAVALSVGQVHYSGFFDLEGGGLSQDFTTSDAADLFLSANVAVQFQGLVGGNSNPGMFNLLLDGITVDSWNAGVAAPLQTETYAFATLVPGVAPGEHKLAIEVIRYGQASYNLVQYIDDVTVSVVPEPASVTLIVVAAFCACGGKLVWTRAPARRASRMLPAERPLDERHIKHLPGASFQ